MSDKFQLSDMISVAGSDRLEWPKTAPKMPPVTDETLPALPPTPTELTHLETLAEKAREFARRA
ncbi:hypothetical protein ABTM18_19970, partial [Acinetobacter baumannii]